MDILRFLQEIMNVHETPSSLYARNIELKSSLEEENKFHEDVFTTVATLTSSTNEAIKAL